jgi:hypothetical protein
MVSYGYNYKIEGFQAFIKVIRFYSASTRSSYRPVLLLLRDPAIYAVYFLVGVGIYFTLQ